MQVIFGTILAFSEVEWSKTRVKICVKTPVFASIFLNSRLCIKWS